MVFTVEISETTADTLVVDILRSSLRHIRQDIERLNSKSALMEHETQDLADACDMQGHLVAVIRYYLPPDKWDSI
jgi:hypothetical protein